MNFLELQRDVRFLITGSSTGTIDYSLADMTSSANRHTENTISLILKNSGVWQYDDDNFANLSIGNTNLVEGQQDYGVKATDFLRISEVAVLDRNGNWRILEPIDRRGKNIAQKLADLERDANNGLPRMYDKIGSSILLYPKPSASQVTLAFGLRITFQRGVNYFVLADTTKSPGFSPLYHRLVSFGMVIDYCLANGLTRKRTEIELEKQKMEALLVEFYSDRSDIEIKLSLGSEDYGHGLLIN